MRDRVRARRVHRRLSVTPLPRVLPDKINDIQPGSIDDMGGAETRVESGDVSWADAIDSEMYTNNPRWQT